MKKDLLRFILFLLIMAVCSCAVPDSRIPNKKNEIVADTGKAILKELNAIRQYKKVEIKEITGTQEKPKEIVEESTEEPAEGVESYVEEYVEEYIETPEDSISIEDIENDYFPKENDEESLTNYSPGLIPSGSYKITAYEWTGNPCANGNYPTEGYTVACNDLPLGTEVYIEGVGYRVVEDRGGGGYGWMDLYLGDVNSCYEWGVQYREVYIVE